jgi:hypothetical protein
MQNKGRIKHRWFSEHAHDIVEAIGNIAAVAVFIGIAYLILRYLTNYG